MFRQLDIVKNSKYNIFDFKLNVSLTNTRNKTNYI